MKKIIAVTFFTILTQVSFGQSYGDYAITINVNGNGFAHTSTVYFDDESWDPLNPPTYGWDSCCDALMILGNSDQPHVFTEVVAPPEPANSNRLSINGLPHVFEYTTIPLGFLPGQLASYNFVFKELYTLPAGMTVELEDLSLNVTQDLLLDSTYSTWGAPSDDEQRFAIHIYPNNITSTNLLGDEISEPEMVLRDGVIEFNQLESSCNYVFTLYDIQGKQLFEYAVSNSSTVIFDNVLNESKGLYILNLRGCNLQWSKRVFVK